jgi:hypothetical protein
MTPITIEPNPRRFGAVTGGPPLSVQLMVKTPSQIVEHHVDLQ